MELLLYFVFCIVVKFKKVSISKRVNFKPIQNKLSKMTRFIVAIPTLLGVSLWILSLLINPVQFVYAEGSRTLFPATYPGSTSCGNSATTGCRAYLEVAPGTFWLNKINRRTFLYVYAEAGEYLLLGSSNLTATNPGDVKIYTPQDFGIPGNETIPSTTALSCITQSPNGFIDTRAKELAGPNSADGTQTVTNGYAPCSYQAPVTGIYGVEFGVNPSAANTGVTGIINSPIVGLRGSVSAWEVTVRSTANSITDLNGRVFTYAWEAITGGNPRPLFTTHYYVTRDGYRYSEKFNGIDPNGYVLYANSLGFLDNGQPLYKDIRGTNAVLSVLPGGVSTQLPEFPMFFSDITPGVNDAEVNKVLTSLNIPLTPPSPTVYDVSFTGHVPVTLHSTPGIGGTIQFSSTDTITYQIVISRDGIDFSPETTTNAVLTGVAGTGTHTINWDGKDTNGVNFPESATPYLY